MNTSDLSLVVDVKDLYGVEGTPRNANANSDSSSE